MRTVTSNAVQASFSVIEDDPELIQVGMTADEWTDVLAALSGHPKAAVISQATGIKLLE